MTQNRGGGAAGVDGDFAPTQQYQPIDSGVQPSGTPLAQTPTKHLPPSDASPATGSPQFQTARDFAHQATQPAEPPLEHNAALRPPSNATETAVPYQSASLGMEGEASRRALALDTWPEVEGGADPQLDREPPGPVKDVGQRVSNTSEVSSREHIGHLAERGGSLYTPVSSPSTSQPCSRPPPKQKSRLSMASNAWEEPFSPFKHPQPVPDSAKANSPGRGNIHGQGGIQINKGGLRSNPVQASSGSISQHVKEDMEAFKKFLVAQPRYAGLKEVHSSPDSLRELILSIHPLAFSCFPFYSLSQPHPDPSSPSSLQQTSMNPYVYQIPTWSSQLGFRA